MGRHRVSAWEDYDALGRRDAKRSSVEGRGFRRETTRRRRSSRVRALGPAWRVSTSRAEASARASRNTREPKKNQAFLPPPPGIVRVPVQKKWWLHHGDYFLSVSFQSVKGAFQKIGYYSVQRRASSSRGARPLAIISERTQRPNAASRLLSRGVHRHRAYPPRRDVRAVRSRAGFSLARRARRARVPRGFARGKRKHSPPPHVHPRPRPILRPPSLSRSSEDDEPRPGRVSGPPP